MGLRGAPVVVVVVSALALAPGALASSGDVAATSRYLRANYTLVHTAYSRVKQVESSLRDLVAQVRRECPGAAAGSPEEALSVQLRTEVIGTIVLTVVHLDIAAGQAYLAAVRGLSWSNAALTREVRAYAAKVSRLISLPVPDLCGDVESWVRSGYTTLSSSTQPFDTSFLASWISPGFQPGGLRGYESPSLRSLARSTAREESAIVEVEAREVPILGEILNTLGLH